MRNRFFVGTAITALAIAVFALSADAASYYVDQNHPKASDKNPGTQELPWKTILKSAGTMVAGDTVYVKNGTYRECIRPKNSGLPGKPITYAAFKGHAPVIKGSDVVTGWKRHKGAVWMKEGWGVPKKNWRWVDRAKAKTQEAFWKDAPLAGAKKLTWTDRYDTLRPGKLFADLDAHVLYVWLQDGSDPNTHTMEVATRAFLWRNHWDKKAKEYLVVRGFRMRHTSTLAVTNWSAVIMNGNHNRFEDCIVSWVDHNGFGASGNHITVKNCTFAYCGLRGLGGGHGRYHLYENCRILHNNLDNYNPGGAGAGTKFMYLSDSIIRNVEAAYNCGPGLWLDHANFRNTVENCRCHDNQGPGIFIEVSFDNTVRNNICYNNSARPAQYMRYCDAVPRGLMTTPFLHDGSQYIGIGIYISHLPETVVHNNLCFNNYSTGLLIHGADRKGAVERSKTENVKEFKKGVLSVRNVKVYNNILMNNGVQLEIRERNDPKSTVYGNEVECNLLYSQRSAPLFSYAGKIYNSPKEMASTGLGGEWLVTDPQFEHSAGHDYRLGPRSPALDVGKDLGAGYKGIEGQPRPVGKGWDLGPYEGTAYAVAAPEPVDPATKPKRPKNLTYVPIDLSKFLNRSLADDTADDGKGSWNDQGPGRDMRKFPTGRLTFGGVPFDIKKPRSCVAFKSPVRKGELPVSIVIPVNKNIRVLYFLHTCAWTGKKVHAIYTLNFDDGDKHVIRLEGGVNIHDWIHPSPKFQYESYTTTTAVKSVKTALGDRAKLYRMEWVSPNTWARLKTIKVASGNQGVFALFAVTAGVSK